MVSAARYYVMILISSDTGDIFSHSQTKTTSKRVRTLAKVVFEIHTQRSQLLRCNDRRDCGLELALGIELLELLQVDSQILRHEIVVTNRHPSGLHCLWCSDSLIRIYRKK